jgi:hypothetical protein
MVYQNDGGSNGVNGHSYYPHMFVGPIITFPVTLNYEALKEEVAVQKKLAQRLTPALYVNERLKITL